MKNGSKNSVNKKIFIYNFVTKEKTETKTNNKIQKIVFILRIWYINDKHFSNT